MIIGLKVSNATIGSNLTVQLAPVHDSGAAHQENNSNPIIIGMHDMVHSLPSQK